MSPRLGEDVPVIAHQECVNCGRSVEVDTDCVCEQDEHREEADDVRIETA